jgi:predicted DNA-binding protein
MTTERRTVRIRPELWQSVKVKAEHNQETASEVIRRALEAYVRPVYRVTPAQRWRRDAE